MKKLFCDWCGGENQVSSFCIQCEGKHDQKAARTMRKNGATGLIEMGNGHRPETILNVFGTMCDNCPQRAVVKCCGFYFCENHADRHEQSKPNDRA